MSQFLNLLSDELHTRAEQEIGVMAKLKEEEGNFKVSRLTVNFIIGKYQ